MQDLLPWLAVAGLGLYHGLNPAMGWLFAGGMGVEHKSREAVLFSLFPIAIGHALSITLVAGLVIMAGFFIDETALRLLSGSALIAWGVYCLFSGKSHLMPASLTAGFAGLGLWSFLMASAHGAGLMLVPALMPLCLSSGPAAALGATGSFAVAGGAVLVHMGAMLAATGALALLFYRGAQSGFLKDRARLLDFLWIGALLAAGVWLILSV